MTLASFDWSSLAVEQNKRNVSKTKQTMKYIQGALRRRWATLVEAALALVGGLQKKKNLHLVATRDTRYQGNALEKYNSLINQMQPQLILEAAWTSS